MHGCCRVSTILQCKGFAFGRVAGRGVFTHSLQELLVAGLGWVSEVDVPRTNALSSVTERRSSGKMSSLSWTRIGLPGNLHAGHSFSLPCRHCGRHLLGTRMNECKVTARSANMAACMSGCCSGEATCWTGHDEV